MHRSDRRSAARTGKGFAGSRIASSFPARFGCTHTHTTSDLCFRFFIKGRIILSPRSIHAVLVEVAIPPFYFLSTHAPLARCPRYHFFATLSTCTVTGRSKCFSIHNLGSVLAPNCENPPRMAMLYCASSPKRFLGFLLRTHKLRLWMMDYPEILVCPSSLLVTWFN